MKNVAISAYSTTELANCLVNRNLSPTARLQLNGLVKLLQSKEAFTVNANQMSSSQSNMIHGLIRDVATHCGYEFEELKSAVKKQFGIECSFKDLSQQQSIDLCDKIRAWVNEG